MYFNRYDIFVHVLSYMHKNDFFLFSPMSEIRDSFFRKLCYIILHAKNEYMFKTAMLSHPGNFKIHSSLLIIGQLNSSPKMSTDFMQQALDTMVIFFKAGRDSYITLVMLPLKRE